jgi:MoaA/NifB/PqqE/SkfB family radical SAM enzyme
MRLHVHALLTAPEARSTMPRSDGPGELPVGGIVGDAARQARRVVRDTGLDSLILFVTSTCNLRCGFCCYAEHLNTARDIPLEHLRTIARTAPPFRALLVSGGEPFLRKDLDEVMRAFTERGVEAISIPTNGWYDERTLATLGRFLAADDHTIVNLSVSVDGFAPFHDRVRGRARSFERLCRTLRRLEPLQDRYPNLRVRLNTVVTAGNVDDTRALVDWCASTFPSLDEHALEVVRDLTVADADHTSADRRDLADHYVDLVAHAEQAYRRRAGRRGQVPGLPDGLGNVLGAAHSAAAAAVKRDRIHGRRWGFPCTAGARIAVVDGEGTLKACEHRDAVVDLAAHGWDLSAALAGAAMADERRRIRADACDCIHGCFVGNSLQHSARAIARREVPAAVRVLLHRSR